MEVITYEKLSELKRWDKNYRVGNVEAIIASITRFGFNQALRVWDEKTVMAGNHSLVALQTMKANGATPPKHIELDKKGEWLVPCIDVCHLSETEAMAFAIADNRTSELAQNDPGRLSDLLKELSEDESLLETSGYVPADLDRLLAELAKEDEFKPEEDATGQGRIDEKNKVTCPSCGTEFAP